MYILLTLDLKGLDLPGLDLPGLDLPGLDLPSLDLPGLDLLDIILSFNTPNLLLQCANKWKSSLDLLDISIYSAICLFAKGPMKWEFIMIQNVIILHNNYILVEFWNFQIQLRMSNLISTLFYQRDYWFWSHKKFGDQISK